MKNETLISKILSKKKSYNKITIPYFALYLFFALILLYALFLLSIFLPGFSGRVTDNNTGLPVKGADVIVFTEIRPFKYLLFYEVPHSISVTKTDKEGRFRINNYFKFYPGLVGSRQVYIYKHDYYALHYVQEKKLNITEHNYLDFPSTKDRSLRLFSTNEFYLTKDANEVNSVESLLGEAGRFALYLQFENEASYLAIKPIFMELYKHFSSESEQIKETLKKKHIIENWEIDLRVLKRGLSDVPPEK